MNIIDSRDKFLEMFACSLFIEFLILDDQIEQFTALDEFHHQVQISFRFDNLIDLHDVWMM